MEKEYEEEVYVSRTSRKKAAKAIEDLAHRLVDLGEADLARLPASPEVMRELEVARKTAGRGSHKRQVKFLAGVLRKREDETSTLLAFLDGVEDGQLAETRAFHAMEKLRERLCDAELFADALSEACSQYPLLDRSQVTRLARSVHQNGDRRAFREIFKKLREAYDLSKDTP